MTSSPAGSERPADPATVGAPAGSRSEDLTGLTEELVRHARMLHLMKAQLSDSLPGNLDWAAAALLGRLVRCGPRRQGELADRALLDPSTVSRYVGHLVRAGLVERRPDPEDGRAVRLAATEAGCAVEQQVTDRRDAVLHRVLTGWERHDLRALTDLLRRFNDDMEVLRTAPVEDGPPAPAPAPHLSTDHGSTE